MKEKVLAYMRRHSMLAPQDNVVVALSGGADSVALFFFLLHNGGQLGLGRLLAAHLNHGLRGAEAERDAEFVAALCQREGVPLFTREARMLERQQERPAGQGTEEWARGLRYAWFEELAAAQDAKVATAHTLSDNAETVLFRASRGTGPKGLAGIPPVRGVFVRPFLCVGRAEVEDYCVRHELAYVEDSTNSDPYFARNRLRRDVLPALKQVHPGAERALARLAEDMGELSAWLDEQARLLLKDAAAARAKPHCGESRGQEEANGVGKTLLVNDESGLLGAWDAPQFLAAPAPVRRAALAILSGPDINRDALNELERVLAGKRQALDMPGGRTARLQRGSLCLYAPAAPKSGSFEIPFRLGDIALPNGGFLRVSLLKTSARRQVFEKNGQKCLTFFADYDTIMQHDNGGVFRARRPADRFAPAGRGLSKPVRKWMNEQRVDPARRDSWPLLAAGHCVLWVAGGGFGREVAARPGARQLLHIAQINNLGEEGYAGELV